MVVRIKEDVCRGCKMCIRICPSRAIEMKGSTAFINGKCTGCGSCVSLCPMGAIEKE